MNFILLLLFSLVLGLDPCQFEAFQPTTIEKVMECYSNFKDEGMVVKNRTVENIKKYLDLNVFSEYYLDTNLSNMEKSIDLWKSIDEIGEKTYDCEYDFHWDVVQLMLSLKDPHSVYRFPTCFTRVYYLLPFGFNSRVDEEGQHIYITDLPPDYSFVTVYFQKNKDGLFDGVDELLRAASEEMEVQEMKIKYDHKYYSDEFEDIYDSALNAMKIWSDRHVYISRNSGARFNSALRSDFYLHASDYGIPFYNIEIKVGGVWFNIPWIAVPSQTIGGISDLISISPLIDDLTTNSSQVGTGDMGEVVRRIRKSAEERMLASMSERPLTPKMVTMKSDGVESQSKTNSVSKFIAESYNKSATSSSSTLTRIYIGDNISLHLYKTKSDDQSGSKEKFEAYVISIPSFSPNDYDQFVYDLREILDYIYSKQDEDNTTIIIDVRENGGGYVDLGNKLLYYLVPSDVDSNSSGFYMRKKCPLNDYLANNKYMSVLDGDDGLYDYYSHSILDSDDYYNDGNEYTQNINRSSDVKFMSGYTFSPLDFYDYSGQRRSDRGDTYNSNLSLKYYFGINNSKMPIDKTKFSVLVVTDGTCGSTCATFLNHAIEVNAVTVIGVGGFYNNDGESSETLSSSSFAGGSVLDSKSFEDLFSYLGVSSEDDPSIPDVMPRDNYIRFPYNALMSFRDNSVALEFQQLPVSISIPYFAPLNLSVTDSMRQMLDFVIPRIVDNQGGNSKANTINNYISATNSCESTLDNSRMGYYYDPEKGDFNDVCEPVGCEAGYYPIYGCVGSLSKMAICTCVQLEETETPTGDLGWVAILCIILAVLICVAVLVFWLIRVKRGNKFGDTGFTKQCCCPCCFHNKKGDLESDEMLNGSLEDVQISTSDESSHKLLSN